MDEVGELDGVLDKEHGDVVADEVEVAFGGIELDGKAAHVAREVGRAARAGHRREAHEHRCLHGRVLEKRRLRESSERLVHLEMTVGRCAARVHHALQNALMIEVSDLLPKDEVLEERRAPRPSLERASSGYR
jgi:hypothetical protein